MYSLKLISRLSVISPGPTEGYSLPRLGARSGDLWHWHTESHRLDKSALRLPVRIASELVTVLKFLEEFPLPRLCPSRQQADDVAMQL